MILDNIQLKGFRNLKDVTLNPSHTLNVVIGKNGSGKSSLMEAIYYLGYGRSFRTPKHKSVINHDCDNFSVFARCTVNDEIVKIGLSRNRQEDFICSINGERSKRLSSLASLVPIQIFTPQSTDLILGSPSVRRRFLDWGVFHVEPSFNKVFQVYSRLVKQRNSLLRNKERGGAHEHSYWTSQMALYGENLEASRVAYLSSLKSLFNAICREFLPEFSLEISYYRGWEKGVSLGEVLERKWSNDEKLGYTSSGPHKADLRFKVDGQNAQEILSRGQLRMAVAAIQLAQTKLVAQHKNSKTIFLLDDVGAELDKVKRELFIDGLLKTNTQIFVTAIEKEQLEFINKYKNTKMFHVEHGRVIEE